MNRKTALMACLTLVTLTLLVVLPPSKHQEERKHDPPPQAEDSKRPAIAIRNTARIEAADTSRQAIPARYPAYSFEAMEKAVTEIPEFPVNPSPELLEVVRPFPVKYFKLERSTGKGYTAVEIKLITSDAFAVTTIVLYITDGPEVSERIMEDFKLVIPTLFEPAVQRISTNSNDVAVFFDQLRAPSQYPNDIMATKDNILIYVSCSTRYRFDAARLDDTFAQYVARKVLSNLTTAKR